MVLMKTFIFLNFLATEQTHIVIIYSPFETLIFFFLGSRTLNRDFYNSGIFEINQLLFAHLIRMNPIQLVINFLIMIFISMIELSFDLMNGKNVKYIISFFNFCPILWLKFLLAAKLVTYDIIQQLYHKIIIIYFLLTLYIPYETMVSLL